MPVIYGGFAPTHGQTLGTIQFVTSGFETQILDLKWPGIKREAIEVTNMNVQPTTDGSGNFGNKMFIPSAYVDPGELQLEILHDPTQSFPITDPNKTGPEEIIIKLGPAATSQETFAALGFMTSYEINGPLDGRAVTANVGVKLTDDVGDTYDSSGAVTLTLAS